MNQIKYQKDHLSCVNFRNGAQPIIEYIFFSKGNRRENIVNEKSIVFVLNGTLTISYEKNIHKTIEKGKAFVLPPGCTYSAFFNQDVNIIVFRLKDEIRFCDRISLKNLYTNQSIANEIYLLNINDQIQSFLYSLINYLADGIFCEIFLKMKIQELLYLLRLYYPKNNLILFFQPVLSCKMSFSDFVHHNYSKVKTVRELADLSSYSISGFEKEFKKVFGSSVYKWMTAKKVQLLYHKINATNKTFKQISEEMGFSSLSQMNDYCKKHLGFPPGKIRRDNLTIEKK